ALAHLSAQPGHRPGPLPSRRGRHRGGAHNRAPRAAVAARSGGDPGVLANRCAAHRGPRPHPEGCMSLVRAEFLKALTLPSTRWLTLVVVISALTLPPLASTESAETPASGTVELLLRVLQIP